MYVTMMMTDQIPLELPPLLNGEVAMMPHLVNGEATQQVGAVRGKLRSNCLRGKHEPRNCFTLRIKDLWSGSLVVLEVSVFVLALLYVFLKYQKLWFLKIANLTSSS